MNHHDMIQDKNHEINLLHESWMIIIIIMKNPIDLIQCIQVFQKEEEISCENDAWYCSNCKDFMCG